MLVCGVIFHRFRRLCDRNDLDRNPHESGRLNIPASAKWKALHLATVTLTNWRGSNRVEIMLHINARPWLD